MWCVCESYVCSQYQVQPAGLPGVWLWDGVRWTIWLHPIIQTVVYQRNRSRMGVCVCVCEHAAHKYPLPHRGPSDGDGERMLLSDWMLLILALGTSLYSAPKWEAYRWAEQSTGLAGWPEGALLLTQADQSQTYSYTHSIKAAETLSPFQTSDKGTLAVQPATPWAQCEWGIVS